MLYCKVICLSLLVFLSILSLSHAFRAEEIVGGYNAHESNSKYQAAIVGKYNTSDVTYIFGGAAIISDKLLLSAARCVMGFNCKIRKVAFYAIIGQIVISKNHLSLKAIVKVYTYLYSCALDRNDITVIELKNRLQLGTNLVGLNIPTPGDDLWKTRTGSVTGFGAQSLLDASVVEDRGRVAINDVDEHKLNYISVQKLSETVCISLYGSIYMETSFCGVVKPDMRKKHRGICTGDIGNPFIIDDTIYGIASKLSPDCNDVRHGSLYTNVSQFHPFIDGIKTKAPIEYTVTHNNFRHITELTVN